MLHSSVCQLAASLCKILAVLVCFGSISSHDKNKKENTLKDLRGENKAESK